MKKIVSLLIFTLALICCSDLQARSYFEIVESETNLEITFTPVTVPSGSVKEEIIPLTNVKPKDYEGIIGFMKEDNIDNYKTILTHESYVNPNFHIRYEMLYKNDGGLVALYRRLENRSSVEDWNFDTRTVYLEWYLLKVRTQ